MSITLLISEKVRNRMLGSEQERQVLSAIEDAVRKVNEQYAGKEDRDLYTLQDLWNAVSTDLKAGTNRISEDDPIIYLTETDQKVYAIEFCYSVDAVGAVHPWGEIIFCPARKSAVFSSLYYENGDNRESGLSVGFNLDREITSISEELNDTFGEELSNKMIELVYNIIGGTTVIRLS